MPENPTDLDRRIRDLVGRAVADAPAPPELHRARVVPLSHRRHPWTFVAIGAAAAAVVAVAVIAVVSTDDDARQIIGTRDTTTTTPTSVVPSSTVPPPGTTQPAPTTAPQPTAPPTTITVPATSPPIVVQPTVVPAQAVPLHGESIVTTGLDGVRWFDGRRDIVVTDQPMAVALQYREGPAAALVMQKRSGYELESTPADTTLLIWRQSTRRLTPLLTDPDPGGFYRLHDVAEVDGVPTLLFEVQPVPDFNSDDRSTLYAMSLIDLVPVEVAKVGGWEAGTSQLHLATNGVIVGSESAGPNVAFASWSVGSGTAIRAEQLGLDPNGYGDCGDCPAVFTISPDGSTVGWIQAGRMELRDIVDGTSNSLSLPSALQTARSLELSADRQLVLGHDRPSSFVELGPAAIYEPFAGGPAAGLPGTFATFGASVLPEDPLATVGGAAWIDAAELAGIVGRTFPDLDSAAVAAEQDLGAALTGGDGEPRLRRDPVPGGVGVLLAHTNVPDDSVVEMYYFLAVRQVAGGVEVTAAQRAALGRDATICGTATIPCA